MKLAKIITVSCVNSICSNSINYYNNEKNKRNEVKTKILSNKTIANNSNKNTICESLLSHKNWFKIRHEYENINIIICLFFVSLFI